MDARRPPPTASRRQRGAWAEAAACAYLQRQGLRPVAANAHFRQGELDLVMLHADARGRWSLVFVEVRYRGSASHGGGAASVDVRKQRKLVLAAQQFLLAHPQHALRPCRFDVIEAEGDPASPRLHWLQDAFRADDT